MQVFVTGATGVLGKAVVKRLIAEGHAVHALSRTEANREMLRSQCRLIQEIFMDSNAYAAIRAEQLAKTSGSSSTEEAKR